MGRIPTSPFSPELSSAVRDVVQKYVLATHTFQNLLDSGVFLCICVISQFLEETSHLLASLCNASYVSARQIIVSHLHSHLKLIFAR